MCPTEEQGLHHEALKSPGIRGAQSELSVRIIEKPYAEEIGGSEPGGTKSKMISRFLEWVFFCLLDFILKESVQWKDY